MVCIITLPDCLRREDGPKIGSDGMFCVSLKGG